MRARLAPRVLTALGLGAVIALGAGLGAVVGGGDREQSGTPTPSGGVAATVTATTPDGRPDPVPAAVRRMSTERKVAQLFLWGVPGTGPLPPKVAGLAPRDLGGVVLGRGNYADPGQLRGADGLGRAPASACAPLVMAVQQGGEFNALPGLPPATAPADLDDAAQGAREARTAGQALRPLGVNGVLAPILDVGPPDGVAVGALAFSDRAPDVARYARARDRGLPPGKGVRRGRALPRAGLGLPARGRGTRQRGAVRARDRARRGGAVQARHPGGHPRDRGVQRPVRLRRLRHPGHPVATGHDRAAAGQAGVRGRDADQRPDRPGGDRAGAPPRSAVQALRAGADLLYISAPAADQAAAYRAVLAAVREKRVSAARLDEAVARVLGAKRDYGLLR